jgi:hypothetical protein
MLLVPTIRILLATAAENVETETAEHITGAFCTLTQGVYTHLHRQVANIIYQELAITCVLSKGKPIPYYKQEPHLCYRTRKPYYARSMTTNRTVHNRQDTAVLDKTIRGAYSIDAAAPNSHNLYSTIAERLRKCTDLKMG